MIIRIPSFVGADLSGEASNSLILKGPYMKKISVSEIIKLKNLYDYKLHAARWNGSDHPLDVFVRDHNEWFHWNTWRSNKDEFSRDYIFSLIDFYHETDMWLFGGIYKVISRSNVTQGHGYEIEEVAEYSPFVGRLKNSITKTSTR